MRVGVLGDLEVERDGVPVPLGGRKPRQLLALLVAARGRTVATERLIDQLWGDEPPPKVLTALHVYVAKLRRELEPRRGPRERPEVLITRPSGYALVLPERAVDADRFEQLVAGAALDEALGLWRGPAYAGLTEAPALAAEAGRLEEVRLAAVEQLWAARLDRGEDAVGELTSLVAAHPTRERLWALLVVALYRSGRQTDALEALRRVRAHLADELGIDPGPELRRLEEEVLRQDDALLAAPAPAARRTEPAVEPVAVVRADLLVRTQRLVEQAAAGSGRVLLVTGEPGIGKTRLARAVAEQAAAAGMRRAEGAWDAEGSPPLWGWTRALGADLAAPVEGGEDTATATFRLADAALTRLTRDGGSCLVLDDVQWADPDSLRLLGRLAGMVAGAPVLLVVLCREPAADTPGLVGLFGTLTRLGAERIALSGLDAAETRAVVRQTTGVEIGPAVGERIRERTDGNPFYVLELVRLLAEEGALADPGAGAWRLVPHGVRDTVRHRLAELPPGVRDAVAAVAVLGRSADLDVLEAYWADDVALLDEALDAALAAGLLTADGNGRIGFPHALVRDAVHGDLSPTTRRRMHERAAETIERARVGHLDEHAVALAEHYRLAGPAHTRAAWTYAERAARSAAAAGAHGDAARLLASAADLQAGDPLAEPVERERVLVAWGTALRRSGRIAEAWAPLRDAAESALVRGDARAAAGALLVVTEQVLWSWRTEHAADEDAVALWQRVLAVLPPAEDGLRARCLAALAVEVLHDPPGGRCAAWADEALALARRQDDVAVRIDVLHVLVNALRRPDLMPRRVPACDELVELCARRGDERSLAVALAKRALNHSAFGRPDDALADLQRALVLAERHRLAPALMIIHLGRAVLFQARGEWAASEEALEAAELVQSTLLMAGAGIGASVRATALLAQGRLPEDGELVSTAERVHPAFADLRALLLVRAGRTAEARAVLGAWREQPDLPWDYLWVTGAAVRALLWAELADADAVAELRRRLEPFADRIADGAMAAGFLGSVHHALATLALAAGDLPAARAEAQAARDLHRRLGWTPWERLSQELLGRIPA
nr:AfsR/SARP family transcriptional regulator [Petropleomorpha daqingensis]